MKVCFLMFSHSTIDIQWNWHLLAVGAIHNIAGVLKLQTKGSLMGMRFVKNFLNGSFNDSISGFREYKTFKITFLFIKRPDSKSRSFDNQSTLFGLTKKTWFKRVSFGNRTTLVMLTIFDSSPGLLITLIGQLKSLILHSRPHGSVHLY